MVLLPRLELISAKDRPYNYEWASTLFIGNRQDSRWRASVLFIVNNNSPKPVQEVNFYGAIKKRINNYLYISRIKDVFVAGIIN